MNDQQMKRALITIGKECFVTYYELFSNGSLRNSDMAKQIQEERRQYTWKSCQSRASHARAIIRARRAGDALLLVHQSKRVSYHIRQKALRIANSLKQGTAG